MRCPTFLKAVVARYDYVVVDSPPLISITDTHLLSGYVDGILFVVNGLVSPRDMVQEAREQLHDRPVLAWCSTGSARPGNTAITTEHPPTPRSCCPALDRRTPARRPLAASS